MYTFHENLNQVYSICTTCTQCMYISVVLVNNNYNSTHFIVTSVITEQS